MSSTNRRIWSWCLLWLLLAALPMVAVAEEGRISEETIGAMLEAALERVGSPGLSAALVVDHEVVYSGGAGYADLEHQVPATAQTVYRIGSISKPIAATAVMQLVEAGKVGLDESIHDYVPQFPVKNGRPITLREILTHTSGIRHYKPGEMLHAQRHDTLESAIGIFKDDPLRFEPGERFSYSSYAFNLLQGVVEKASGQVFEDYLREHVWQPAGMKATYFDRAETLVPHRARPYERTEDGAYRNAPYVDLSLKWAGGGMMSTVEDLARFHVALCRHQLLSSESCRAMYEPLVDVTNRTPKQSMGLGWFNSVDDDGRHWVWHSGGSVGARTILLRVPEEGLAAIVLTNCSDSRDVRQVAEQLIEYVTAAAPQ